MTNGQNAVRGRHLDSLASAVADKLSSIHGGESYEDFTGATSNAGGARGLVPAPSAGDNTKFLRGDGSWVVPTDTNTTYSAATTTTSGLMSENDKKKLDGIDSGAEVNAIEEIWVDGVQQSITNKKATLDLDDYAKKSDVASVWKRKGSVNSFSDLPTNAEEGDVYNIKTAGGTDGEGIAVKAGDNVVRTSDGKWDVLAGTVDLSGYVEKVTGKQLSTNDFTDAQKNKLNNLASITTAGDNITISGGTIKSANTTYSDASTTASGLMSASDKIKLNGIAASANNYTLPTASSSTKGGVKIGTGLSMSTDTLNATVMTAATSSASGKAGLVPAPAAGKQTSFLRGDGTWVIPTDTNTTYSAATTTTSGLMSAADKKKLNNLASITTAGDNITITNGTIKSANTTYSAATTVSSGLMSSSDKKKLNNLASITTAGSNITISGGTISASNPVMTGATASTNGAAGLVPAPVVSERDKFLRGDGTWLQPPVVLGTTPIAKEGGFWFELKSNSPVVKICHNNTAYSLGGATSTGVAVQNLPPPGTALNNCSWEEISAVSHAGLGDTFFDIGDCKEITLNGKIGDCLTLTNEKLCVFILHFNYAMNGTAENNIIFGGFKTALTDGIDVALVDSKYNTSATDGTICFNMNHWGNGNYGGWKGSDLRYDVLGATSTQPSDYGKKHTTACVGYNATSATLTNPKANTLLAALPIDFRGALRLWSRWVDAKGNSSNVEANIKETIDAVTLLTEWEVQGNRTYANDYEKNHQTQMDYYKNGNSKIKYKHTSISSSGYWWCSSPCFDSSTSFCYVRADSSANINNAFSAYGVSPAFKV